MSGDWFHCGLKPISRAAGRSAVACAAYRAGMAFEDQRYGVVRDFTHKKDVVASFTLAPENAPDWASDPAQLWNAVEAKEKRKDAQLAFEWEIALPNELDPAQRETIARAFTGWLVKEYGVGVTTGIHEGGDRGNGLNDHMHVMMTTRPVDEDGFAAKKLRQFNTRPGVKNPEVDRVREQAAGMINTALESAGSSERVDHRSFKARGLDKVPTTHLGPGATAYERQGYQTERGDINRAIIDERLRWQQEEAQPDITATLERELAARFGEGRAGDGYGRSKPSAEAVEPEPAPPAAPREVRQAAMAETIHQAIDALPEPPQADAGAILPEAETARAARTASLEAAIRQVIASLKHTGEAWKGAGLWQHTIEFYHRGMEMAAEIARDAVDAWQRHVERDREPELDFEDEHEPDRDGPER